VALDKGQEDDWLSSMFIRWMVGLAIFGFITFMARELRAEKPMVELRIFRERNLAAGTALIFLTCVLLYSVGLLTPQFLQQLMGYSSLAAGVATAPLGLGAALSMILVGYLVSRIDARIILIGGFAIFVLAAFTLSHITLGVSPWTVFWPQILAGSAIGFLFIPVNIVATAALTRDQLGSATSSMNLMRNVGGSVGIAIVSTFLARRSQVHQTMLAGHITPENLTFIQTAQGLRGYFSLHLPSSGDGLGAALAALYRILQQQAWLLAFADVYEGLALVAVVSVVLVLLLRRVKVDASALRL
jgi:DHA2 family multidrug resistance protein